MSQSVFPAYIWAFVSMLVFLVLALVIANAIAYKPNNPGTTQRRIWFWVLFVVSIVAGFTTNLIFYFDITVPSHKANYLLHSSIAAGVFAVGYILLGLVISKMFRNSKVGTIF